MNPRLYLPLVAFLCLGLSVPATAQTAGAFQAALVKQTDMELQKLISLAEAIPADQYSWRPAEGVRSIGEVVAHVAGANYFFPTFVGISIPEGVDPRSFEQSMATKDQAVQILKESQAHFRQAISNTADAALTEPVNMLGNESTQQGALLLAGGHISEHLGQLIAYARMNGIAPPWSE